MLPTYPQMKIEPTQFIPKFIWNKIQHRENLAKIINNSGWLILEKFVRGMLALLVGAWVARYLGPSDYGNYSFVLAYLAFFQVLSNMGMDGIVVRDIAQIQTNHKFDGDSSENSVNSARIRSKISKILGTAFAIRLIVGSASWVLAVVIIGMTYGWKNQLVQLIFFGGGVLIFQAADTIDLWFQSQSKSKSTVLAKFIAYIFSNGLKIVLIIGEFPLIYFCSVIFIEAAICAASLIFIFKKYSHGYSIWRSDLTSQGLLLIRQSWPFILTGLGIVTYMKIDQIYIKELLSVSELGIYSAAVTIAATGYFIPGIICTSLMPFIASKKNS
jgi:PST family polysaccharide transporter